MKMLPVFLMIALLTVMVMVSCVKDPVRPDTVIDDPIVDPIDPVVFEPFIAKADIRLVQVGENNHELGKIAVGEDINFGELIATESISYILTNTGNVDLFNIDFSANDLIVFPGSIGVLESPEGGLTTSPVVSLTAEHVLPRSGVGSLLNMQVGDFTDTLLLSYQYEIIPFSHAVLNETQIVALMDSIVSINDSTSDTTWAWVYGDTLLSAELEKDTISNQLEYSVGGTKMGAIIDIIASGTNLDEYYSQLTYIPLPGFPFGFLDLPLFTLDTNSTLLDTTIITNSGNVPISIKIESLLHNQTIIDSILAPYSNMDVSGLLRGQLFMMADTNGEYISGELLIIGATVNQPYIFDFFQTKQTSGVIGLMVSEG